MTKSQKKRTPQRAKKNSSTKNSRDLETRAGIEAGQEVMCETRREMEKAGFTVKKIARELALIGFADMADFIEVNEDTGAVRVKSLDVLKSKSRIIRKIREDRTIRENSDGSSVLVHDQFTFELHDKLDALGKAISILGIQKPQKIDMNVRGSLMAAVAKHLSGGK